MIELVVFLGNPGKEYARSRHNAGFLLAKHLPFYGALDWRKKYQGLYASVETAGLSPSGDPPSVPEPPERIHFLMPETYMNLSGESVRAAAAFFKIKPEAILVVHDELELPFGTLSLKFSGGLGGHNGLRSIKAYLGVPDFWRLRIGIGRPDKRRPGQGGPEGSGEGIVDWVLSPFSAAETESLEKILDKGALILAQTLVRGPESLLPEWRKKALRDL
jgi:PTH1 family peptidyl-tRNA hydrolase